MPHSLMGRYPMYINGKSRTDLLIYGFKSHTQKKGHPPDKRYMFLMQMNAAAKKNTHDIKMKRTHFDLIIEWIEPFEWNSRIRDIKLSIDLVSLGIFFPAYRAIFRIPNINQRFHHSGVNLIRLEYWLHTDTVTHLSVKHWFPQRTTCWLCA